MDRIVEEISGRKRIIYKENDLIHNVNGPAIYTYFITGELKSIQYYLFGKPYVREKDLPNYIQFYISGKFFIKEYRNQNNELHRLTGPAKILYYEKSISPCEEYYLDGNYFPYWMPKVKFNRIIEGELNKNILVKAILFNRTYGLALKDIYDSMIF